MLISQHIAKNVRFLSKMFEDKEHNLETIRNKVIDSVKIIVSSEFINYDLTMGQQHNYDIYNNQKDISKLKPKDKTFVDNINQFGIPIFDLIFIENEEIGVLVEKVVFIERGFTFNYKFTFIRKNGWVVPSTDYVRILFDNSEPNRFPKCYRTLTRNALDLIIENTIKTEPNMTIEEVTNFGAFQTVYHCSNILQIFVFMNVKNIELIKYTPSQKENKMVPFAVRNKFVYRILDVYRDRKVYDSLSDITNIINGKDSKTSIKRAHLVRGHFKNKHGVLFWWNPFMRNRNNLVTQGFAEKGYRVNN